MPIERQIEAAPSIAGPVLFALRFMEDDNPVTELFLNLLKRAIDRERVHEAHPAFPRIIEQLEPDEAVILFLMRKRGHFCVAPNHKQHNSLPVEYLAHPENLEFYCIHLASLDLVQRSTTSFIERTEFAEHFIRACVPETMEGIDPA